MRFQHVFLGLLILPAFSITPGYADAPPRVCTWFRADPAAGPWQVFQGSCKVTVTGNHLDAILYDDKRPDWARMKLSGSIQGDKVTTQVELEGTDAGMELFTGDLKTNALFGMVMVLREGSSTIGIKYGPN